MFGFLYFYLTLNCFLCKKKKNSFDFFLIVPIYISFWVFGIFEISVQRLK